MEDLTAHLWTFDQWVLLCGQTRGLGSPHEGGWYLPQSEDKELVQQEYAQLLLK